VKQINENEREKRRISLLLVIFFIRYRSDYMKGLFRYIPSEEMGRRVKEEVLKRKCGKGVAVCAIVR
jgi:hypothetical protein